MKGRITTVLSLAGVLVAGSAAALVNTQVLKSNEAAAADLVAVESTDGSGVTPTTSITTTSLDGTVSTKSMAPVLAGAFSATQAIYQIGDAGLVTLDTAGDVLTIVSATPSTGWTVVKAENYSPVDVEVKLQSGSTIVEFRANLTLGVVTTSVESKTLSSAPSTPSSGTTAGSGTVDNNDDDAEHESEDHENEDSEDDD